MSSVLPLSAQIMHFCFVSIYCPSTIIHLLLYIVLHASIQFHGIVGISKILHYFIGSGKDYLFIVCFIGKGMTIYILLII